MATEIYMVEGDTAPTRTISIVRKSTGSIVNLTGATVSLVLLDTGSDTVTNAGHQTCTVVPPATDGIVTYSFQSGDIASANVHFGDLRIAFADSKVETDFDRLLIRVRPKVQTVS